ncbi:MAG: PLP-dependent transferase [Cytophagales bacterium]|nr:MAG: PLP-dependent transferase [Cytophagales bacterium]
MDIFEIINQVGENREEYLGAVSPPIFQTAMFATKTVAAMREKIAHESDSPFYSRGTNPSFQQVAQKIAQLEKAEDCLLFASGSAAVSAAVLVHLEQGNHIVSVQKPYSWSKKLMTEFLPRFGVTTSFVEGTISENFEKAIQKNTKVIYLESPNSWTFEQQNIEEVVKIAKKYNLITVFDNSYATPINQNPIALGVDIVIHSGTKYLSGHSDTVAGVLCASKMITKKIFASEYMTLGGVISPLNAWLLLRGLRTLPLRMKQVAETTPKIVDFLANHPKIEEVFYPFHEKNPQFALAKKQMKQGTGQFTIALKTDNQEKVERFCEKLHHFLLAVSWGSYESLIFPACALPLQTGNYKSGDLKPNWVRFSVGFEEADTLIADLENALQEI